ncbi:TPA: hypothetical protein ACOEQV_000094 [Stenotrophomonas maltophilia]
MLKGPASVNYGAMPPGGLINFVSKRPHANPLQEVELQVGNYGLKQAAFDIGGALNNSGSVLHRPVGLARNSDGAMQAVVHIHQGAAGVSARGSFDGSHEIVAEGEADITSRL